MSDAPLTVRRARASDIEAIAEAARIMAVETEGKHFEAATVLRGVRTVLEEPHRGFYLVAERDGRIVGQLGVTFEWSDWRAADWWWVQSVYVAPEARRQGVFRALHEQLLEEARLAGRLCGIRLYFERENRTAQATYEALGFRPADYHMYQITFLDDH
ncbi:MAG: GNAT family N-acetyltransferase [Planctomycetes bacterium]|nr:GNAT family N-acetyltransferase [Planctomycetota bacterium]